MTEEKYANYEALREKIRKLINAEPAIDPARLVNDIMDCVPVHRVGDGTPDAALAIGEEAFRAGFAAGKGRVPPVAPGTPETADEAWSDYEPSEHVKALS